MPTWWLVSSRNTRRPWRASVIRTTSLLERLFREERRRVNAAGTLFGERAVLKLMYAALVRASDRWRGIRISEFERRQLERLRDQLVADHRQRHSPAVTNESTPSHVSRKKGT